MVKSVDPVRTNDSFFALLKRDEALKAQRCDELSKAVVDIPVSDSLLDEIAWLGPTYRVTVLRRHPGYHVFRKLESLWSVLSVFEQAYADLLTQLDRFHSFSLTTEMGRPSGRRVLLAIATAINKELMALSVAAAALVDHGRRVRKIVQVPDFDLQRSTIFDAQEHRFIIEVRNLISHEEFPDIGWQIKHGESRTTDFVMSSRGLLEISDLHIEARDFIARCGEHVYLRTVAESYTDKVRQFHIWYAQAIEEQSPPALEDYRRVSRFCKTVSMRAVNRLLIHQYMAANVDPFTHLEKILLPEQIEAAMKLPLRSKEQVDFIIAAADEYNACDDELRQMIYKLFGVEQVLKKQ